MSSHKYGTIAEERPDLIEFLVEKSDAMRINTILEVRSK